MASTKTRLRSIRKRASKNTNKKTNKITIDGDDFWWIMKQSEKIALLEEIAEEKVLEVNK